MGGCYACMKYLYIFLNFLFLIFGIAGVALIIWMLLDPTIPLHFTQEPNDFMISAGIYLVVAIVLVIVAIMGMYSVSKEVRWALVFSFCLLLIIVVVEVASGVWGYVNRERLEAFARVSVKNTVQKVYDKDENVRTMFDTIQSKMHCCGSESPSDWNTATEIKMSVSFTPTVYSIPTSCCREGVLEQDCIAATQNRKAADELNTKIIYSNGCYNIILEKIVDSICIIMGVCGAILAVQLLGLILGIILAFSMNRSNRYKA